MEATIQMVLLKDSIKGKAGKPVEVYTERAAQVLERKGLAERVGTAPPEPVASVDEDPLGLNEPVKVAAPAATIKKPSNSHKK